MKILLILSFALMITACGGGGGSDTKTPDKVDSTYVAPDQKWNDNTWSELRWK